MGQPRWDRNVLEKDPKDRGEVYDFEDWDKLHPSVSSRKSCPAVVPVQISPCRDNLLETCLQLLDVVKQNPNSCLEIEFYTKSVYSDACVSLLMVAEHYFPHLSIKPTAVPGGFMTESNYFPNFQHEYIDPTLNSEHHFSLLRASQSIQLDALEPDACIASVLPSPDIDNPQNSAILATRSGGLLHGAYSDAIQQRRKNILQKIYQVPKITHQTSETKKLALV